MSFNFSKIGSPVLVISHPRSGTHLTIDFIRKNFSDFQGWKWPFEPLHYLYLSIEGFLERNEKKRLSEKKAFNIVQKVNRPVIKMHTYSYDILWKKYPSWMEWLENEGKTIYVTRDVRAMLCSYYVYAQDVEKNANVPISEFIQQSYCGRKNRPYYWNEMNKHWLNKEGILALKYEYIVNEPHKTASLLGSFLKAPKADLINPLPMQLKSMWDFRRMQLKFMPESTAIMGSRKNVKTPKWRKVFTEKDIEFIHRYAGESMKLLGYE